MATQYTEEFKVNAVKYWNDHPDLGIGICAKNLGIVKVLFLTGERPIHWICIFFYHIHSSFSPQLPYMHAHHIQSKTKLLVPFIPNRL